MYIGQASLYKKYIHESSKNKASSCWGLLWNIIITIISYHLAYSGPMDILNVKWCALLQTLTAGDVHPYEELKNSALM